MSKAATCPSFIVQQEANTALAAELVKSQVSIIFATGSPVPARAAKAATSTITIVFAYGL
jgi:hypothetical protein